MATPPKGMDRRVQRTHQLLRQAAIEVMQEKGFLATTIQDIADRANVNRGTFYAHFADKYALLDEIIREQFHGLLASKLPSPLSWNRKTLHLLIQVVLDHFEDEYRQCDPVEIIDPLIERATQEALGETLLSWLKQGQRGETSWPIPVETLARVMSWTILGAAAHWGRETTLRSSEQVADDVLLVIMEGIARLVPNTLLE